MSTAVVPAGPINSINMTDLMLSIIFNPPQTKIKKKATLTAWLQGPLTLKKPPLLHGSPLPLVWNGNAPGLAPLTVSPDLRKLSASELRRVENLTITRTDWCNSPCGEGAIVVRGGVPKRTKVTNTIAYFYDLKT